MQNETYQSVPVLSIYLSKFHQKDEVVAHNYAIKYSELELFVPKARSSYEEPTKNEVRPYP